MARINVAPLDIPETVTPGVEVDDCDFDECDSDENATEGVGDFSGILEASGIAKLADNPLLQEVIRGAMDGSLPLDRELEVNQPRKLSHRAIQAIMLAIGGFYTSQEIAEISGMNYVYVTKLIKHPYAQRILTIANAAAVEELSVVSRRLRHKSPRMLEIAENIAESPLADPGVRLRAAFGWLDRAGHGPTQKSEGNVNHNHTISLPPARSKLIATAIREANEVQEADFEIIEEGERLAS